MEPVWRSMPCAVSELSLGITLACGQSFRWFERSKGIWTSVLHGRLLSLRQTENELQYCIHATSPDCLDKDDTSMLEDYFQLKVSLKDLYRKWSKADKNFSSISDSFTGVRMLRQDPVENLFSFICSSNNNISRISGMVEKLCSNFGDNIGALDGKDYFTFPSVSTLANDGVETQLRSLGFGYRAKYIQMAACYIHQEKSEAWLHSLRDVPYEKAKGELMEMMGVGAKVADCVCLMSLDKHNAIPVDTHVWQIASKDYMAKLRTSKSLTPTLYKEIGDCFRNLWGDYAGWAHSVLFSADLKKFEKKLMQSEKQAGDQKRKHENQSIKKAKLPKKAKKRMR